MGDLRASGLVSWAELEVEGEEPLVCSEMCSQDSSSFCSLLIPDAMIGMMAT